jgi:hypothetical protein
MVTSPKRVQIALCAAALVALPVAASAANFTTVSDACGEGCTTISIIGKIEVNDDDRFDRLIKNQNIDKALVRLDSPGGYIAPTMVMGDRIRYAGFWTYVPNGAICTSACADIWLAGRKRFLAPNGRLGFHSTGQTINGIRVPAPSGDAAVLVYFRRLGLSDEAISYFFAASTFDISYVTLRTLRQLGVDCDSFPPPMVAKATKTVRTEKTDKPAPEITPRAVETVPFRIPQGGVTIVPKTTEHEPGQSMQPVEPPPDPDKELPIPQWEILGVPRFVPDVPQGPRFELPISRDHILYALALGFLLACLILCGLLIKLFAIIVYRLCVWIAESFANGAPILPPPLPPEPSLPHAVGCAAVGAALQAAATPILKPNPRSPWYIPQEA